jgi:hypothetical protein
MLRKYAHLGALATAVMLAGVSFAPTRLAAQTPTVLYGCYVPASGTVYRIKADGLPSECRSKNHVQFTWSLAGPLSGRELVVGSGTAAPNSVGTGVATCPAGKKVIAGGFRGLTGPTTTVSHSMPRKIQGQDPGSFTYSDTEWEVILHNADQFTLFFDVFAICANAQ